MASCPTQVVAVLSGDCREISSPPNMILGAGNATSTAMTRFSEAIVAITTSSELGAV
jgi:hypothetical protein